MAVGYFEGASPYSKHENYAPDYSVLVGGGGIVQYRRINKKVPTPDMQALKKHL
jgi:hypothetical protein